MFFACDSTTMLQPSSLRLLPASLGSKALWVWSVRAGKPGSHPRCQACFLMGFSYPCSLACGGCLPPARTR